ncbi:HK97 family phage prohead protease [Celeribacter sp. ULVN23_4]
MLTSFSDNAGLELRAAGDGTRRLHGRFPYGKRAVLSDGGRTGRPRKEVIQPRAFAYRVEQPKEEIHLLIGHSYDKPLASKNAGTLILNDADDALTFEAIITPEVQRTTWWQDWLASFEAGLIMGISPGFRIPPKRTVPDAETVEEEDPAEGLALIRNIWAALLYELSFVTRPAYDETEVEARSWEKSEGGVITPKRGAYRWR